MLYRKEYHDFLNIKDVRAVQEEKLLEILGRNKDCEYGKLYGFGEVRSIEEFQDRLPLTDYEDYLPYIERIMKGEKGILTREDVLLLELSSGSTSASKLIPYTKSLKEEFQKGIRPWLCDLYSSREGLRSGKSYWSVTPAATKNRYTEGGIPIGFEDDKEYFGVLEKKLLDIVLAVPGAAAKSESIEEFYYRTALELLKCRELTLISIWNPSFLMLILEYMERNSERLAADIAVMDEERAEEVVRLLLVRAYGRLWKNLKLISCWCDGNAEIYADRLKEIFPGVELQPKGLLATEGFVSFPLTAAGGAVLSVRSHFFEFQSAEDGRVFTADRLERGREYSVILTTSGGFYRYRLKDVIEVTGFHNGIPVVRFLGKLDKVSDLFGEKLNEVFVKDALEKHGIKDGFFMMAPETDRYVLYLSAGEEDLGIAESIEVSLRENFHYDYCRKLGQLKPLRVFALTGNPEKEYLEECVKRGQKLGDIKPAVLHLKGGWDKVFKGEYS
jgi:hypothetical protein